ncbi:helix-turn-helix transcriptional regulator [Methanosarcina sp. T3]|uniref:helix-turn-helix transcriptional regulator n=1 Tax=Methanosarcina sp. T3 TaxID=3439062 RepID=UPI003F86B298
MLAVGILLLSSIVAIDLLLEDTPVVIQLDGDAFKVIDIPYVYTVKEAYILFFSGFFGGLALAQVLLSLRVSGSFYPLQEPSGKLTTVNASAESVFEKNVELFPYNTPSEDVFPSEGALPSGPDIDPTDVLLRALEGDERKAIELIVNKGGKILQNELVNSLDFSKAKVSRVLMNLERRGIIDKKKYGLTNCISIAEGLVRDDGMKGEMK